MPSLCGYRPVPRPTLANLAVSLPLNNDIEYSMPVGFKGVATEVTAGAATYTAKQLLGGIILRDPTGASRADVLPTCTLIAASFKGICSGSSLDFSIKNTADADEVITLTVGAGMTAYSGTSLTINRGETANYTLVFAISATGVCTADLYRASTATVELPAAASMIVTQGTSTTTAVVINSPQGVITSYVTTTLAALTPLTFAMTNSYLRTTSVVTISVEYVGAGNPTARLSTLANGTVDVIVTNLHASAALNAVFKIHFRISNA